MMLRWISEVPPAIVPGTESTYERVNCADIGARASFSSQRFACSPKTLVPVRARRCTSSDMNIFAVGMVVESVQPWDFDEGSSTTTYATGTIDFDEGAST